MNFNADKPIEKLSDDKLGRSAFAKHLGKAIGEYSGKDGLVIGLYGKWGSGKTSIIKMIIDHINTQKPQEAKSHIGDGKGEAESQNGDKNISPIVIEFSPWNYSDKSDLIRLFFLTVENNICKNESEKLKQYKIGELFANYADAVDAFSIIPIAGKPVASILKAAVRFQGNHMLQKPDLDESRRNLENALNDAEQRIVVIIDDIDRLSNEQIRDIFQLVKKVGDLPYITYLLAMDREIVRKALEDVHNINGDEYLEKIIQIPFEIPMLKRETVEDILEEEFEKVCGENEEAEYDLNYFQLVKSNCLAPYIGTLRQVNRAMNLFRFRYGYLKNETNPVDLLALTVLEVSEPELYRWIGINEEILIPRRMKSGETSLKESCEKEFREIGLNTNIAMRCVATIFPEFAENIGDETYKVMPLSVNGRGNQLRMAHSYNRFNLYFLFDLERCVRFKRSELNKYLYKSDDAELKEFLGGFAEPMELYHFVRELIPLLNRVSYDRLKIVVSALLDFLNENYLQETNNSIDDEEDEENSVEEMMVEATDLIKYEAWDAITRFSNQEEKLDAIRYAIDKFDILENTNILDMIGDWFESELEENNGGDEENKSYYSGLKKLKKIFDEQSDLSN